MTVRIDVSLGPLTKRVCQCAPWTGSDQFPANQAWADDFEHVLEYLNSQGQFERFLRILQGGLSQRDGAVAEARAAYYFARKGFDIVSWEPPGGSRSIGEFEICWQKDDLVFVEVKGPGWVSAP
jgi:hypothetical protein